MNLEELLKDDEETEMRGGKGDNDTNTNETKTIKDKDNSSSLATKIITPTNSNVFKTYAIRDQIITINIINPIDEVSP